MSEITFNVGDQFASNGGRGPQQAEIVAIVDDAAHLERWGADEKRRVPFTLSLYYLSSTRCGWKPVEPGFVATSRVTTRVKNKQKYEAIIARRKMIRKAYDAIRYTDRRLANRFAKALGGSMPATDEMMVEVDRVIAEASPQPGGRTDD